MMYTSYKNSSESETTYFESTVPAEETFKEKLFVILVFHDKQICQI